MIPKLFFCFPVRRNWCLQTLALFRSNFSTLAQSDVANSNVPSQNLFLDFVTSRFNMSSADAAKMLKRAPSLGRLQTLDNVEQVISMLNSFGCTEDQISKIIRTDSSLLGTSVERVLEPKLQMLKDIGVGRENITKVVTWLPWILSSKFEVLRSNLELLKTVFPRQDLLIRAVGKNFILGRSLQKSFKLSVAFWKDFGFCGTDLTMFLLVDPGVLRCISLTPEQRDLIRKIGIHKESFKYKYFVSIVALSRIEVLESRINNLQLCGFSPEEAWELVRFYPQFLKTSEEKIMEKMNFMRNHMGLSVDFVVKHPRMFTMSLEKVIRPRFLVLQNMTAMNAAGEVYPTRIFTVLMMNKAQFVAQIIERHPESAALLTVYKNAIANV